MTFDTAVLVWIGIVTTALIPWLMVVERRIGSIRENMASINATMNNGMKEDIRMMQSDLNELRESLHRTDNKIASLVNQANGDGRRRGG